jgi:rubrerythrin
MYVGMALLHEHLTDDGWTRVQCDDCHDLAPADLAPWVLDGHGWIVSDDLADHVCPICAQARERSPVVTFAAHQRRDRPQISV